MFSSPSSLEIISVAQILLNLGDEALSGSLHINKNPPLWIDQGNLIMSGPWKSVRNLVPLLALNSGSVQFNEVEELEESFLSKPSKSLDWCVFETLRLFDREWEQHLDKLPDSDTSLKITDEFRGTIELNRIEQSIYDSLEVKNSTSEELARRLSLDVKQVRVVCCRLSTIGLLEEIHQLETISSIRQAKHPTVTSPLPKPVSNQLLIGLPIVSLVFLWLFNIFGGTELKLLGFLQRLTAYQESLDNIVIIELDKSETENISKVTQIINQADPALVGLVSDRVPTNLTGIDYIGLTGDNQDEVLNSDRILAATRIIDGDGIERRGLIGEEHDGDFQYSFGAKLALERLKQFNITPQWHDTKPQFSLSRTNVSVLTYSNSLYPRQGLNGYQVLLNPLHELKTITPQKLEELKIDGDLAEALDHKIVILGAKSSSTEDYSLASDLQLQSSIANQILLSATYGRKFMQASSRWYAIGFSLVAWIIIFQVSLKIRESEHKSPKLIFLVTSIVASYVSLVLFSFFNGIWISFSYPVVAALLGVVSAFSYKPIIANSYIDAESKLLSNKGFYDTIRKLLDIQFDNLENSTFYIISVENFAYLTDTKNAKNLLGSIIKSITDIVENFEAVEDYTIGRLNTNRFGLLIPNLSFDTSKLLKKTFSDTLSILNQKFKGASPKITIGMSLFDGENYISPIQLVASADSDSLSFVSDTPPT